MKKLMIFLTVLVTSLTLAGCTDSGEVVVPPTYVGITVNGSSPTLDGELTTYYKGKQGIILVDVQLTNPSNVDIKSININGYTYNSSRFLEDSTNTLIKLEVNVGDVLGETVYSVDRFTYVDGETTSNVDVSGNNEFNVYVFKDFPEVKRDSYSTDRTSITIDFIITDVDDIIVSSTLRAVIYDGDTLIDTVYITDKTDGEVVFTDLNTDKHYDVQVYGSFNRDDTNGLVEDYAFTSDTYVTLSNGIPSAIFDNISVNANQIELDVDLTDLDNVVVDGGLRVAVYKGETFVTQTFIASDVTDVIFADLLNDTEYTIKVLADYDLDDGNQVYTDRELASHTFTTLKRDIPVPQIQNLEIEENSIDFDLVIEDEKGIIDITSVYAILIIDGEEVDSANIYNNHVSLQVNNMYSGQDFELQVVADYDLNDGEGKQFDQIIHTEILSTKSNVEPEVNNFSIVVEQGYITVSLNVADPNSTLIGSLVAVLYEQDATTGEEVEVQNFTFDKTTKEIIFTYPTRKDVNYYIEVYADYNLRDGVGTYFEQSLYRQVSYTAEAKAPIAEISNVVFDTNSIDFDVLIIDADNTIFAGTTYARIYNGDTFVTEVLLDELSEEIEFLNLFSDHQYRIDIVTKYDLDDGTEIFIESILESISITTEANEVPTISLDREESKITTDTIIVDSLITDNSLVVDMTSMVARIYHVSDLVNHVEEIALDELSENDITFGGLYSDSDYVVKIFVDYNLRDGNNTISNYEIGTVDATTVNKLVPVVSISSIVTTSKTLTINLRVDDPDFVVGDELIAVLYDSNGETAFVKDLQTNMDQSITFEGLLSDETYKVHVFADYNLDDLVNDLTHQEIEISDGSNTDPLDEINVEVTNVTSTLDSITFDANIIDLDGVIQSGLQVTLYTLVDGELDTSVASLPLISGLQEGVSFTGLTSDTDYRLVFTSTYSLNDQTGIVTNGEIGHKDTRTKTKTPPTTYVSEITVTENQVSFDLELNDYYGVMLENTLYAELWDGETLKARKQIQTDDISFDLTGFLANQTLEIRINGDYNLGDGEGNQISQEFGRYEFITISFDAPEVSIVDVVPTQNTVEAYIIVRDSDDVITGNLKAVLYDKDNLVLQTIDLGVGENNISFGVTMNAQEAYSIVVYSDYNLRNGEATIVGEEMAEHVEYMESKFLPEAEINSIIPTKDSVSFIVDVYDYHDVIVDGTTFVELYHNGALVETSSAISGLGNNISFPIAGSDLFSNSDYEIKVVTDYINDENVGVKTHQTIAKTEVTTTQKDFPTINIVNKNETLTEGIKLTIDITDNDAVIELGTVTVEVYHKDDMNTPVDTYVMPGLTLVDYTFSNLYSNNDYVVVVTVTYNMNDEIGDVVGYELGTLNITTAEKQAPEVSFEYITFEKDSVSLDVFVDDEDNVITGNLRVVLYDSDGETLFVDVIDPNVTETVVFTGIYSDEPYYIYVFADYDMNDQIHIYTNREIERSARYESLSKLELVVSITDSYTTLDALGFNIYVADPDTVYQGNLKAVIFDSSDLENALETIDLVIGQNTVEFDLLNSDTDYRVYIYSDYDLNDKDEVQVEQKIGTLSLRTLTKLPPEAIKANEVVSESDVTFDLYLSDQFDVFVSGTMTASLYKDDVLITSKLIFTDKVSFSLEGFPSDYEFEIVINGSYNLGDGSGVQNGEFGRYTFRTNAKSVPTVEVSGDVDITQETVDISFAINDNDITISSDITITLYSADDINNTTPLEVITIAKIDRDSFTKVHTYVFTESLEIEKFYLITVTASYDLNDATGEKEDQILFEQLVYMDSKLAPEANITNETHTEDSITVTVDIIDGFNTIIAGTTVVDLKLDGVVIQTSAPITGLGQVVTFNGLVSNLEYTYSVRTDYDLNEDLTDGINTDMDITATADTTVSTTPKQVLTGNITIKDTTINSIIIDMNVVDDDTVREAGSLWLYVYNSNDLNTVVHQFNLVNLSYTDYVISGLDSDNQYLFQLQADYDLDEDDDPVIIADYLLSEVLESTVAREAISASVTYTSLVGTTLTMDVEIEDPDNTLTGNLKVVLYDSEGATAFVYDQTDGLVVGNNSNIEFTGLLNNEPYYIYVFADYDLYDTINTFTDELLVTSQRIETDALDPMFGTITSINSDLTSITFTANIEDLDGVYTSNLRAYLYLASDLENAIDDIDLVVGSNTKTFTGLNTDTSYVIKIMTDYNLNSKAGDLTDRLLDQASIDTLIKVAPSINVNNLQITEDDVTFILSVNDQFGVYQPTTLTATLYVDGILRTSKALTTDFVSFDLSSFLADQEFEIVITGDYDLDDGNGVVNGSIGTVEGSTLAYVVPTGTITSVEVHQETLDFVVLIDDPNETATTNLQAVLVDGAGVIVDTVSLTNGLNSKSFSVTVNEHEAYTIFIYTDYNLRDGEGEVLAHVLQEYVKYVDSKLAPEATITNVSFDKTSITFTPTVYDYDLTINGATVAKLYIDGTWQATLPVVSGVPMTFNTLLSNTEYYIEITTEYNNSSGIGDVVDYKVANQVVTTDAKVEAEFDIDLDTRTSDTLIYDIVITDNDSVTGVMEAVLYNNITEVGRETVTDGNNINVEFLGLTGNTGYRIVIEYVQNLNDGQGNTNEVFEAGESSTEVVTEPTATITVTAQHLQLDVDYTVVDDDSATSSRELVLYKDGVEAERQSIGVGTSSYSFTDLEQNTDYKVELEVIYDLNDLNGNQTVVLATDDTDTLSLIGVENEVVGKKENTLDVTVDNSEGYITSPILTATLKRDGLTVATYIVVYDIATTIDMLNLLSDYTYTLEISGDVNYGSGVLSNEVIYTHEFTTLPLEDATGIIQEASSWVFAGTLAFTVDVTDVDAVVETDSWEVDIYEDGVFKETVTLTGLTTGTGNVLTIQNDYDATAHAYTVVLKAQTDMNDTVGHDYANQNIASRTFIDMNE